MIAKEEVHKLAPEEKLQVMEWLWEDLSRNEDQIPVPDWHLRILDERLRAVQEGKGEFIAWREMKRNLSDSDE